MLSCYDCPNTTNFYGTIKSVKNDVVGSANARHCEQSSTCSLVVGWVELGEEKRRREWEADFCLWIYKSPYSTLRKKEGVYVLVVVAGIITLVVMSHSSLEWREGKRRVGKRSREINNEQQYWYIESLYIIKLLIYSFIMHSYSIWLGNTGGLPY